PGLACGRKEAVVVVEPLVVLGPQLALPSGEAGRPPAAVGLGKGADRRRHWRHQSPTPTCQHHFVGHFHHRTDIGTQSGILFEKHGERPYAVGVGLIKRLASMRSGLGQRTSYAQPSFSKSQIRRAEGSICPLRTPWRAPVGSAWCELCQLSPKEMIAKGQKLVA